MLRTRDGANTASAATSLGASPTTAAQPHRMTRSWTCASKAPQELEADEPMQGRTPVSVQDYVSGWQRWLHDRGDAAL